jgi:hypothetical protein
MFQQENGDLRRAPLCGLQPAFDLLDLLQSAFGARLADAIVRQCELAQASAKKMMGTMMCDGRIDKLDVGGIASQERIRPLELLSNPFGIDDKKYRRFVLKPSVKGLGCKARAPRDLVGVGAFKAAFGKFLRCSCSAK